MREATSRDVVELSRDRVRRQCGVEPAEQVRAVGSSHSSEPVGEQVGWDVTPRPALRNVANELKVTVGWRLDLVVTENLRPGAHHASEWGEARVRIRDLRRARAVETREVADRVPDG